jgi:hypothetical protein
MSWRCLSGNKLMNQQEEEQAIELRRKQKTMERLDYRNINDKELPEYLRNFKKYTYKEYLIRLKDKDIKTMLPENREKIIKAMEYLGDLEIKEMGVLNSD